MSHYKRAGQLGAGTYTTPRTRDILSKAHRQIRTALNIAVMATATTDEPMGSALYRVIESRDKKDELLDITKYLVAYKAATLIPFAQRGQPGFGAVDGSSPITTAEGPDATLNITIYAQDLYLLAGSTFSYPGKRVSIFADRIIAVRPIKTTIPEIKFDCRGSKASDLEGKPKAPNESPQNQWNSHTGEEHFNNGTQGETGATNTIVPSEGGTFLISGRLYCNADVDVSLIVDCNGGTGGRGQEGGPGGKGGKGAETAVVSPAPHYPRKEIYSGAKGGRGGNGGTGGLGGNGGIIYNFTSPGSLASMSRTKLLFNPTLMNVAGGLPGVGGPAGSGAVGGEAGSASTTTYSGGNGRVPPIPHTRVDPGDAGPRGDEGSIGSQGPSNAKSGCVFRYDADAASKNAIFYGSLDSLHASMVMHRLLFEFQISYCSQAPSIKAPDAKPFLDSLVWTTAQVQHLLRSPGKEVPKALLDEMAKNAGSEHSHLEEVKRLAGDRLFKSIIQPWETKKDARDQLLAAHKLFLTKVFPGTNLDVYEQKLNFIPRPSLRLADLKSNITLLATIERERNAILKQLKADSDSRSVSTATAGSLQKIIDGYQQDRNDLEDQLKKNTQTVLTAKEELRDSRVAAASALDRFWKVMESRYACKDLITVLQKTASLIPLEGSELKVVVNMADQMGNLGKKLGMQNPFDAYTGLVDRNVVYGKIKVIGEQLGPDALQKQIAELTGDTKDPSEANPIDGIVALRESFTALITATFAKIRELEGGGGQLDQAIKTAENALDLMIVKARQLQTAATTTGATVLKLAKMLEEKEVAETTIAKLKNDHLEPGMPLMSLVIAFYSSLLTFQKANVVKFFFDTIRACNGMFLQQSTLTDDIFRFGSFDDITAEQLNNSCTVRLTSDVAKFLKLWDTNPSLRIPGRPAYIIPNDRPDLFGQLREKHKISLELNRKNIKRYFDFNSNWFDIRLRDLEVYFIGAVNTKAKDAPESKTIDVNIRLGDSFGVTDIKGTDHVFSVPVYYTTFTYNYAGDKPTPVTHTSMPAESRFYIDPGLVNEGPANEPYPMRTPYMTFDLEVEDHIDVKNVSQIVIMFDLMTRLR